MKPLIIGALIGMAVSAPAVWGFRTSKPPTLTDLSPSQVAELNVFLERIWNLTNGRYSHDIVTANPNGSRRGDPGDSILYNNADSYKECHNVSATSGGTTWRCSANALTAP